MTDEPTWTELRVHGVSGTPPESLFDRPHVRQVDGDRHSRFFRPVDSGNRVLTAGDGHALEAFHWGAYTSGTWRQSFWLAVLPFGLVNTAAFMLPSSHLTNGQELKGARLCRIVALAALRFLALTLTVMLSFAASLTLIDVVGSRWAARSSLVPEWLSPAVPSIVVVAAGLVVLVLGGASWFGRLVRRRPADVGLDQALRPTPVASRGGDVPLAGQDECVRTPFASAEFYQGDPDTWTLRGLHVAAGLAVPAFMGLRFARLETAGAGVLLVAIIVVTVLLGDVEQASTTGLDADQTRWVTAWHRFAGWLAGIAVIAALVVLGWAANAVYGTKRPDAKDALDRYIVRVNAFDDPTVDLLWAGCIGLVVLAVAVVGLSFATRDARPGDGPASYFRPYSKGMTAIPVGAMALFLGVGYSAAVVIGTSTMLNRGSGGGAPTLGITVMLDRVAYAWGLGVIPALLIGLVLLVRRLTSRSGLTEHALIGYPEGSPFPPDRLASWRSQLGGAVWFARLKNGVEAILWTLVVGGSVLSASILVETFHGNLPGLLGYLSRHSSNGPWASFFTQLGTWVLLGLIVGLVALARGAFRDAGLRRVVNIVWDVIAFWPHSVHPFIPTPYSQRVVGDLAARVRGLATRHGDSARCVVVCGHSQGSLVSFATLNLLADAECNRVGFLSFGSQLRVIFSRAFPLYVNYDAIAHTHHRLGGAWVNLYRDTDHLAGPVLSWEHAGEGDQATSQHFPAPDDGSRADTMTAAYATRRCGDDWRLADPVRRIDPLQPAPVDALLRHSNYWTSPEWKTAVAGAGDAAAGVGTRGRLTARSEWVRVVRRSGPGRREPGAEGHVTSRVEQFWTDPIHLGGSS